MFKTPKVPKWIKDIEAPSPLKYRNIYSFKLGNRNLWGTETLLGDWGGSYLLLAKDFYPTSYIEQAVADGVDKPYRHKPDAPTNRNLLKTLLHFDAIDEMSTTTGCGFLYASACFLLRDDGKVRGTLPYKEAVLSLSAPVIEFTIDNMPNLRTVVAMGEVAAIALGMGGLDHKLSARYVRCIEVHHPSYVMSDRDRFTEWGPVFAK